MNYYNNYDTWSLKVYLIKVQKLLVLVGSLTAFQPYSHPLTFNFSWSLGYIKKLVFGSPFGNYFTPGFVRSQHTAPRNIKHAQTLPFHGTKLTYWSNGSSEIHFLFEGKFTLGQCRIRKNQGPRVLLVNALALDQRARVL